MPTCFCKFLIIGNLDDVGVKVLLLYLHHKVRVFLVIGLSLGLWITNNHIGILVARAVKVYYQCLLKFQEL